MPVRAQVGPMSRLDEVDRGMRHDPDSFAGGYFRNAVHRHWDPHDIEGLDGDRRALLEYAERGTAAEFDELRKSIARFGGGEEAVTADLMPLGLVLEDVDEQMFVATQIYEEAKHVQFFDRYWREVFDPVAAELGYERTVPTAERYVNDAYVDLFDRIEAAMHRLLEEDTPETRADAYCHYHIVAESVAAQTAYYGMQSAFDPRGDRAVIDPDEDREPPRLEGLVEGIAHIRSDEGRHVGFGMWKVRELVQDGPVDESVVEETLTDLMPLVAGVYADLEGPVNHGAVLGYAREKFEQRLEVITEADATLPPVEELVAVEGLEGGGAEADD